jgi:small-conductance mechanosensitive channel
MNNFSVLLLPFLVFVLVVLCGYLLRQVLFRRLQKLTSKTKTQIDDLIIDGTKGPFMIWCVMAGLYFALDVSRLPDNAVQTVGKLLLVLGIISVTFVIAHIGSGLIKYFSSKSSSGLPVSSITQNIVRVVVFTVGTLVLLNSLGISITPILATLGVGGLAVALALQDTLANFFAGFNIILMRQIRVGDYIKLDSGEEGYVADINWRITKILMRSNNLVIVPNEKLSKAIITNFSLPSQDLAVLQEVSVHYKSDLRQVERIAAEVGAQVMKEVTGGVPQFEPFVRFTEFGDSGIKFMMILRAQESGDQPLIKHEFIKRLHDRFNREGIIIPFPIVAVNYDQEKAGQQ